jgi:signal peptidase I
VPDLLVILGCTVAAGLLLRTFLLGAFVVPTRSMESTLVPGDVVLVNRLAYGLTLPDWFPLVSSSGGGLRLVTLSEPRRGDILAFVGHPSDVAGRTAPTLLKRCVGVPGDTLVLAGDRLRGVIVERPTAGRGTKARTIVLPRAGDIVELTPTTAALFRMLVEDDGHMLTIEGDGGVRVDGRLTDRYRVSQDAYFVLGDNRPASLDSRVFGVVPAGRVLGKAVLVFWSRMDQAEPGMFPPLLAGVRWTRIGTLL